MLHFSIATFLHFPFFFLISRNSLKCVVPASPYMRVFTSQFWKLHSKHIVVFNQPYKNKTFICEKLQRSCLSSKLFLLISLDYVPWGFCKVCHNKYRSFSPAYFIKRTRTLDHEKKRTLLRKKADPVDKKQTLLKFFSRFV